MLVGAPVGEEVLALGGEDRLQGSRDFPGMREEGRELQGPDSSRRNGRSRAGSTGDPWQSRHRHRAGSEREKSACFPGQGLSPGAEGGRPRACGRVGVGGEGTHTARRPALLACGAGVLGSMLLPGGETPRMDRGLHVVADMETELGTDPRASSHGEQRQKARRRASQRQWTQNTGCFPRGTDRWARGTKE